MKKVKFPCKLCNGDHLTHLCPKIQDAQRLLVQQGSSSSQVVLTNPFPQGQQLLVDANSNVGTSAGGNQEGENSSNVYMMNSHVDVATRARDYGETETSKAKYVPETTDLLYIERPSAESIPQILKCSANHSTINPNARTAHNYSIVEDLAQSPYAMSALEVLQTCPTQRSVLLLAIGAVDPKNSLVLTFDTLKCQKETSSPYGFPDKVYLPKSQYFLDSYK